MNKSLDAIDRRIVDELQADGRISIVKLAKRVHLTKTPCSERVRRLERSSIISGYHAHIEAAAVDMNHVTIVHVSLSKTGNEALNEFNREVRKIPEVQTCLMIAGPFDYMLKVRTRDIEHFREVLGDRISSLPNVLQTSSFAVMELVKESLVIPMSGD